MPRKTPVLLRRGPLSRNVNVLTRYARKTLPNGHDVISASIKHDVTADFDALMLEELLADDAPDMVGILDGVADGHSLTRKERAQVRAFRERLRKACERHNERIDARAMA